jgi:DNA replication and repair protein RecF
MAAWEERLAAAGARVHRQRREYVLALAARLGPAERMLFSGGESVHVQYRPSPAASAELDPSRFEGQFLEALDRARARDATLGFTGEGPHRDELQVSASGVDLRKFGSSGQLRAAMIVLCVGKLGLLKVDRLEAPLFLMDDFDSDLDERRSTSLLEFLRDGGFQAVMATAKDGFVDGLGMSCHRIRMEGGVARAA